MKKAREGTIDLKQIASAFDISMFKLKPRIILVLQVLYRLKVAKIEGLGKIRFRKRGEDRFVVEVELEKDVGKYVTGSEISYDALKKIFIS